MPRFKHDFTFRTPLVTVTYPKGYTGPLVAGALDAARQANALESENEGDTKGSAKGAAGKGQG